MKPGKFILIPVPLHPDAGPALTEFDRLQIIHIQYFVVENAKAARRWLKNFNLNHDLQDLFIYQIDKHKPHAEQLDLLNPLSDGQDMGFLSDAGCPGFADPGNEFVRKAHELDIEVLPLSGPSSFMLALMASGLNGQKFSFHGYLPIKPNEKIAMLKQFQADAIRSTCTHFFIETPYRNSQFIKTAINNLNPETYFTIAANLTSNNAYLKTRTIAAWRKQAPPDLHKIPAIFAIGV